MSKNRARSIQQKKVITVGDHLAPRTNHPPQPYIFVTLNPSNGAIQAELHEKGSPLRHVVQITDIESLRRILTWRQELAINGDPMHLGEDAHPTEAQIAHWEKHTNRSLKTKLESRCPFCIAEARAETSVPKVRKFDTRGNPIRMVQSASQLGLKKSH